MKAVQQINQGKVRTAEDLIPSRVPLCRHSTEIQMKIYKSQVFFRDNVPLVMKRPEPLAGVTIQNITRKTGVVTATDGTFRIEAFPDDVIQISYVGMTTIRHKAKELPVAVYLTEDIIDLPEVVVTGDRNKTPKVPTNGNNSPKITIKDDPIHSKEKWKKWFFIGGGSLLAVAILGGVIWASTKKKKSK